jgi:hypothetical protein
MPYISILLAPQSSLPSSRQAKFSIRDSEAVFAGIEEQDVVEGLDYSLFKVKLKKFS